MSDELMFWWLKFIVFPLCLVLCVAAVAEPIWAWWRKK